MNSFKTIRLESVDRIATLTLSRPQTLNSITPQFMDELYAACEQIGADAETRVVILTATGRGFCSGLDLNLLDPAGLTNDLAELGGLIEHWQQVYNAFENLPQVTVAAINGITLGAGVELILCCDFRVASTRAFFGLPEVKLGIIPDLGGLTRLTRTVGPAWAKEMVLRARNLSAMESLRIGLVNRVADPGDLMGIARKWASQFAQLPPPAVRQAKRLINSTFDLSSTESLHQAKTAQLELLASEEFRAAVRSAREDKPQEVQDLQGSAPSE